MTSPFNRLLLKSSIYIVWSIASMHTENNIFLIVAIKIKDCVDLLVGILDKGTLRFEYENLTLFFPWIKQSINCIDLLVGILDKGTLKHEYELF
jgi:hypothetical protein